MASHILIVDDDQELVQITASFLEKKGYLVTQAANGLLAKNKIRKQRPDLILLDVLMPEMDGFTFYKELKTSQITTDIPVLIMTGRGKMEDSFKVLGVDGFVAKPCGPQDLLDEIEKILLIAGSQQRKTDAGDEQSRKKVLLVGHEKDILDGMMSQAEKLGYLTQTVMSGFEAIALTVKFLPDIVFIDVLLKDMSPGELTDILRRLPQCETKPIIGFCFYETEKLGDTATRKELLRVNDISKRMLQCGATDYMGRYMHGVFVKTMLHYLEGKK